MNLLAAMSENEAAGLAIGVILFVAVIWIGISVLICYILYKALARVPVQYQQLSPGLVFLNLIPLLHFVWTFIIVTKLSGSMKAYFEAHGDTSVGGCGGGVGIAWAVCQVCSIIPAVGMLSGLASLVCMIIYLVTVSGLKNRIPLGT